MDYPALKTEIALSAYAGMADVQIAAQLQAAITITVDVATSDVRQILLTSGEWGALVIAAATAGPYQAAAITARDTLSLTDTLVLSDPAKLAALNAVLVALGSGGANVIGATSAAAIPALAATTTTRAAQIGCPNLVADDVTAARAYA